MLFYISKKGSLIDKYYSCPRFARSWRSSTSKSRSTILSYATQIVICDSIRETIRQILIKSNQLSTKLKASSVPITDSILRTVTSLVFC